MSGMPPAVWELWILCFWWSTWTLADQHLIPLHPWSEIFVLGACLVVWLVFHKRESIQVFKERVEKELANVTQTPAPATYARQSSAV